MPDTHRIGRGRIWIFLVKLNVLVDAVGDGTLPRLAEDAGTFVANAARYVGLAMVVIGVAVIARSSTGFERTRRADR